VLLTLAGLTAGSLLLAMLGWSLAFAPFVVLVTLTVADVVHLRRQALRKQERAFHEALRDGGAGRREAASGTHAQRVVGVPDRMPTRPAPLGAPLPAAAVRYEDPQPVAAGATASTWDAVEFPVPTYVNAPVAPPRPPRVLDLTRPGEWSAAMESEDVGLSILDEGDELDDILDGRRASGDW
jgi:hypothetical protein